MSDVGAPMYEWGQTYETVGGEHVEILGYSNEGTSYETVHCALHIHRYNRGDYGRVTGTDHKNPDPRNLLPLPNVGDD